MASPIKAKVPGSGTGSGSALIASHIDLGLQAEVLDLTRFKAQAGARMGAFDEAFG